ncbi:MAG: response regulator [Rhodospirillales bacterium]
MAGVVFVADDDPEIRALLAIALADIGGFEVIFSATGAEALTMTDDIRRADIALLDLHLPDMPGSELLTRMRAIAPPGLKFLFLTGATREARQDLEKLQPDGIIPKPFNPLTLASDLKPYFP